MDPLPRLLDALQTVQMAEAEERLTRTDDAEAALIRASFDWREAARAWKDAGYPRPVPTLPSEPPPGFVRVEMAVTVWDDGVVGADVADRHTPIRQVCNQARQRLDRFSGDRFGHVVTVTADVPLPSDPPAVVGTVRS